MGYIFLSITPVQTPAKQIPILTLTKQIPFLFCFYTLLDEAGEPDFKNNKQQSFFPTPFLTGLKKNILNSFETNLYRDVPGSQKEGSAMAIIVQFKDNTYDFVLNNELDDLINSDRIIAFKRSSGWVHISKDPVRRDPSPKRVPGEERRFQY